MISIEFCIPITQEEANIFYSFDYDKDTSVNFRRVLERINDYAMESEPVLIRYLELSQFVDGYFAEDYFDDIAKIAIRKKLFFCKVFKKIDPDKVRRLKSIFSEHCR